MKYLTFGLKNRFDITKTSSAPKCFFCWSFKRSASNKGDAIACFAWKYAVVNVDM